MPIATREQVQQLMRDGAQLIDLLPESEFAEEHLPGAINIPIAKFGTATIAALDPGRATIVYCWDTE